MATLLNLSASTYYAGGTAGASGVVGWTDNQNRVFRVSFTVPKEGANHLSFKFGRHGLGGGSASAPIRFYVGTSDDSHRNAGASYEYTGTVKMERQSDGTYISSGEADILLLPNKVYYLWIFPGSTTYGWFYWYRGVSEAYSSGAAGIVRAKINGKDVILQPVVKIDGVVKNAIGLTKMNGKESIFV